MERECRGDEIEQMEREYREIDYTERHTREIE